MPIAENDMKTLRGLAWRYAEIANADVTQERLERYKKTVAGEKVRPVVLIAEVPWGEIDDDALACTCAQEAQWIERQMRMALFQWDHFQVDTVILPEFRVQKRSRSTGIGLQAHDTALRGETGTHIAAHEYEDLLKTEADLEKLRIPTIEADPEATAFALEQASSVFDGILPVKAVGQGLHYNLWDVISRYRGVDALLMDLALRPEFMHKTVQKFADIAEAQFSQIEELGLLDPDTLLVHCTVGATDELPAADYAGKARRKDVWGRCAAQIFGSVSPAMHDEFDLAYNEKLFGDCGLVYYGCCEPMDTKIDLLRKRFKNLRKVSITPWADPMRAAEAMGGDLVMAAKPNPAFVASPDFNPQPVEDEMTRYIEACKQHGTTCEFVLKDISTIANKVENLTRWAQTAAAVIDRHYG